MFLSVANLRLAQKKSRASNAWLSGKAPKLSDKPSNVASQTSRVAHNLLVKPYVITESPKINRAPDWEAKADCASIEKKEGLETEFGVKPSNSDQNKRNKTFIQMVNSNLGWILKCKV